MALKTITIDLRYQNYIPGPPSTETQMYAQACGNDKITMDSWKETWLKNIKSSHKRFGSFCDNGCQGLAGLYKHRPVIIAGSGSSLKKNAHLLVEAQKMGIGIVSCLHNFGFLVDLGVKPDDVYFLSLDAGDIVVPEMAEGGKENLEFYSEKSKDYTLLSYVGSPPKLFDTWKGKVRLFNCPVSDPDVMILTNTLAVMDGTIKEPQLEKFGSYVSTGGNALGASMYFAKAVMGGNPIIFVGADFSFGWEKKFHSWDSPYDKQCTGVMYWPDVYGIKVPTWNSYFNFKTWFETVATWRAPGYYINATEGGILGSYPDGNIMQIQQMDLQDVLARYGHWNKYEPGFEMNVPDGFEHPEKGNRLSLY